MLKKNISLKPYNTFGIDVNAESFAVVTSLEQLKKIISEYKEVFILSGGSNILLTKDISKPVISLCTKGIETHEHDDEHVLVTAQAGENWHEFVLWCIDNNYGGIENLSLIPGNVGTSPIQNIGAYGVEIKDTFYQLEALEIETNTIKTFTASDCNFGYRDSFFKREGKGKYIILNVTFKLTRKDHLLRKDYGAIRAELEKTSNTDPSIKDISDIITGIRKAKLPDPKEIGNSGSFFKNPVISKAHFEQLKQSYPKIPSYPAGKNLIKVPAGWLIEQCGFKGKRFGDAGVHKNQALVLVNYGNASGKDILDLAQNIQSTVKQKFDIDLEIEVNII
ncbi:MAG: UDP-N-acetylenolpyruvoylglucosamine reductase [Flavobacteriia bacterium]|nr:MAG: UDP-N-acetylenolpyruvoylglucosamine reductase [Flavobacteriia bacterium]